MRDLSGCPDGSAPCVGLRAAQRWASGVPLAAFLMARLAARDAHEKRHGFGVAPAASPARHVGPRW